MSERLCYIRRTDRGMVLRGLRLVSGHTDDTWSVEPGADPDLVLTSISEAVEWIRQRLEHTKGKQIDALVLDPDGAVCTWVKPEDADPTMLEAAVSEGPIEQDPDELEPHTHNALSERLPRLPRELDFEPLDHEQISTNTRRAVMAVPDVPGRLLKDALDAAGVRPERYTSIWHALCAAWDPGQGSGSDSSRIVSSDAPIAAVVAIDPIDARLIWSWSRQGRLICAGSMRLRRVSGEHEFRAMVRRGDIARLCTDWLGWASQLGVSPSRVVVIGEPVATASEEGTPEQDQALDPQQLGAMLTASWPDATLDLLGEPDPIGATLQRLAQRELSGTLGVISGLEARPTRAHRSMFRWAGLALTAAACVLFFLAWQILSRAGAVKAETQQIRAQKTETLRSYDPDLMLSQIPVLDLETTRDQIARSQATIQIPPPKPILQALETVSFVIGMPGVEINTITVNTHTVTLTITVDDVSRAEQIYSSLRSIDDRLMTWTSMTPQPRSQRVQVNYTAKWRSDWGES